MQDVLDEVLRLIALPLNNGKKLIKGESKFVVESESLHKFNTVLDVLDSEPEIIVFRVERIAFESFGNLLSKIPKLKVTQSSIHSHDHLIDIRRFKKLRHLELIRIPLDKVKGLNVLKPQLEYFLCDHCSEVEIITRSQLQWSELVTLKLKNSPVNIDEKFFISMPWIQHLDLSFTSLRKLEALHCLDNLKYLNISFNHLEKLPPLSSAACCQLQILLINHNYLQNLQGFQYLINLRGLDLSWNWIAEKQALEPLLHLKALQWINMTNTPLSFNKHYRLFVASAIGSSAVPYQFVIDYQGLSRKEQGVIGTGLGIVRCGKGFYCPEDINISEAVSPQAQSTSSIPSTSKSSTGSLLKSSTNKKSNKVREVIIEDLSENRTEDTIKLIDPSESASQKTISEACNEQESEGSNQNGAEEEKIINTLILEAVVKSQQPVNNITSGLVEVEIHDTKYKDKTVCDMFITEDSTEEITQIREPSVSETVPESSTSEEENDKNAYQDILPEQQLSKKTVPTCNEFIQAEVFHESLNKSNNRLSSNIEVDNNKNESTSNDQSDGVNSSTESHQDDQDYYSANEDKDRTKTLSSIDSGELDESPETFLESQQSNESTIISSAEENCSKNETFISSDTPVNRSVNTNESFEDKEVIKMDVDHDSDSESSGGSDIEDEMWHVQKVNTKTSSVQNILLVLLENEIKERSPLSGRTVSKWSLDSVQSCVKTKNEPFTVELEFDTVKPDKQSRTYIMEFSDAQVLIKRLYNILESRPLSAMNQSTFKCLKCDSIFVHTTPTSTKFKVSQVRCAICSSLLVALMEEPRPPEVKSPPSKPISHSPSQSSIGQDKDGNESLAASSTPKISCSAVSFDQAQKVAPLSSGRTTPRKYESDVEIISNPSQSSIEVLDEYGRSQEGTPCRKRSSEERQVVAVPQLSTVLEANAQLSALTESSSSGSLTESVITTYESNYLINKKIIPEESLIEESREGSPETELATNTTQGTLSEENGNITEIKSSSYTDIYNYNDFAQVDVRIKLFLYQSVFRDENEELLLLAKCHLWKTGGADYDACVVFSTTKIYFLSHSFTKFQEEICDWLTLTDTVLLKDTKKIYPIIWQQGAILTTNKITYLILLLDESRTVNFFKFLEGISLKELRIQNYVNTKTEMALQQAVLSSNIRHNSVDPSVSSFSVCLKICITRDDDEQIMRLAGLVLTGSEFHVLPGDLRWLCSNISPSIHVSQQIGSLIEVESTETSLKFHFLDEEEAVEEIWSIKLATREQVLSIIASIKTTWEGMFLVPLEVIQK